MEKLPPNPYNALVHYVMPSANIHSDIIRSALDSICTIVSMEVDQNSLLCLMKGETAKGQKHLQNFFLHYRSLGRELLYACTNVISREQLIEAARC